MEGLLGEALLESEVIELKNDSRPLKTLAKVT